MTAAIILAAGESRRFGSPKQLAIFKGESLLERAVRTANEAGCSPIIVVLGANASHIQQSCNLAGALVYINDLWSEGMASSLRLGVFAVGNADAILVMTCDMPTLTSAHLRALMASDGVVASRYAGNNGVPAFFPAVSFPALLQMQGEAGARSLLCSAHSIDLPGGQADIDTTNDLVNLIRSVNQPSIEAH